MHNKFFWQIFINQRYFDKKSLLFLKAVQFFKPLAVGPIKGQTLEIKIQGVNNHTTMSILT